MVCDPDTPLTHSPLRFLTFHLQLILAKKQRFFCIGLSIRIALGAQIGDVMRLILRQGLALVALGGLILYWAQSLKCYKESEIL
jgi:hypothetical protein